MDQITIKQLGMKSCSVDNIRIMRGEVVRLTMIRDMALADLREAAREKSTSSFDRHVLFGLQMVKATCDVVLGVAGEWSKVTKPISAAYSNASPWAEDLGKLSAGQFGAADLAKSANTGIHSFINKKLGKGSPFEELTDLNKVKADILINALAYDEDAVLASLAEYGAVLANWAVELAKKETLGSMIRTGDEIRKAGLAYHSAYTDWKDGDMASNFDAGMKIMRKQVENITWQIQKLEANLAACGAEMPKLKPASAADLIRTNIPGGPTIRAGR